MLVYPFFKETLLCPLLQNHTHVLALFYHAMVAYMVATNVVASPVRNMRGTRIVLARHLNILLETACWEIDCFCCWLLLLVLLFSIASSVFLWEEQ